MEEHFHWNSSCSFTGLKASDASGKKQYEDARRQQALVEQTQATVYDLSSIAPVKVLPFREVLGNPLAVLLTLEAVQGFKITKYNNSSPTVLSAGEPFVILIRDD